MKLKITYNTTFIKFLLLYLFLHSAHSYSSENRWTLIKTLNPKYLSAEISKILVDPSNPNTLFIVENDSIFKKSDNQGRTWKIKKKGLNCKKINSLTLNQYKSNIIYACTDNGVFKSADKGEEWKHLAFNRINTLSIVISPNPNHDILYMLTSTGFFVWSNGKFSEINIKKNLIVNKIIISPTGDIDVLFFATASGIHKGKVSNKELIWLKQSSKSDYNIVDIVSDYYNTKTIFVLSSSGEIFWADSSGYAWHSMNDGLENFRFSPSSISLNNRKPYVLFLTSLDRKIFSYDFYTPQIGIVEFSSIGLASWESYKIFRGLTRELNKKNRIVILNKNLFPRISNTSQPVNQLRKYAKNNGLSSIISGNMIADPDRIQIKTFIAYSYSKDEYKLELSIKREGDYFNTIIKKIGDEISEALKIKYPWRKNIFNKKNLKWYLSGTISGMILMYFINKHANVKQNKSELPSPKPK